MNYTKLTVEAFNKRLEDGNYAGPAGARRAVGKVISWSQKEKERAYELITKYFGVDETHTAGTPGNANEVVALRDQVLHFKETTKASWKDIAETFGTSRDGLRYFVKTAKAGEAFLARVRAGLSKLDQLTDSLIASGKLTQLEAKPVQKKAVISRASVVEVLPSGMPSALELDLRELELIQRLRQYVLPTPGPHLNGKRV
jgi:hypothetical protein